MFMIRMDELNIYNKRVLIRVDFNVPMKQGKILSDTRILASLPTIKLALQKNAQVIIMSHLGRPCEGVYDDKFSLLPIVEYLKNKLIKYKIKLVKDYLGGIILNQGEIIVLENVRFNHGESKNDEVLARKYAALCDIFVMDAFGIAHRSHASTCGIARFADVSCIGGLFSNELNILSEVMKTPKRPLVVIVGGSKISTKFDLLNTLSKIADYVIVGGGIANTFLAIENKVGRSLYEPNFIGLAKQLLSKYNIQVPIDLRISTEYSENSVDIIKNRTDILGNEFILDFGDKTIQSLVLILKKANTILWNGPLGVYEFPNFRRGTEIIAHTIANSHAFSVAGGGDTLAAIDLFGIKDSISYISTGGGAFLQFIESQSLPIISIMKRHVK
ncbi:phosphoglycerate kinase [Candidatus Pantoea edessiphila]|uniref:Phosphoglycerate kinase n=1 Tax=Candidatus Pantoea edessiphila TaxID=2044610 RepID=A0A2P5SXL6_9GAMM|nr:phosphoglycerate kinase [Candidatus Pantoea edessiphila]MBK4775706.1 phosphoglycerate kinase [Pantoea sp. Edef]PPI87064.1 phosphoglycerate kinase [Candidatus Pantoea edessiphila]